MATNQVNLWKGSVVEESLSDNRILNEIKVSSVKITNEAISDLRWHIYEVYASDEDMQRLHIFLKQKWYMHFWRGEELRILFKDRIFNVSAYDKKSWKEAIDYGLSLGIPEEQLDFVTE